MHRARTSRLPNVPHTLSELGEILIQDEYEYLTTTLDEADNILLGTFGQSNNGTRVVIFASSRALQFMERMPASDQVFSDATFSTVPAPLKDSCRQLWCIVILRRHHVC